MHYRFDVENLETGIITQLKTLKDVAKFIDVPYHQARSLLLSDEKLYLHPNMIQLKTHYKITKNFWIKN